MRHSERSGCLAVTGFGVVGLAFILILGWFIFSATNHQETLTVEDKWIKRASESSDHYLVSTDKGVYRLGDSLWGGSFRASDRYARLEPGSTICAQVTGWRVPFLSWYKNIYKQSEGAC